MPGRKAPGKRSHAKGASKGLRWARGHSCVSNPGTTKYRDAASSQFLHPVSDNPLFTVKNVAAVQAQADDGSDMDEDLTSDVGSLSISDISCGTGLSSVSTLRSLSSSWSKVSTNAFDRFLKRFRSNSLVHKEMLSILAASSEVINSAGGKLKETEFFATFLTFLESCPPDQYQPVMSLLCIIITRVSPTVLKLRFDDIYPKIGTILSYSLENNNDLLIRTCIEAIAKLIRAQGRLNLEDDKQLQGVIYMILKCTLHEKPRVRKKARSVVRRFVSQKETSSNSMVKLTLGWILDQLSCFPTCEAKVVADVLSLLLCVWVSVASISKPGAKKLFEGVLRVMSSGDISIMKIGFTFFIEVFQNFSAIAECDPQDELFSKLIVAAWELQPDTRNTECYVLWLRCILSGLVRLRQGPSNFDLSYLCSSLESCSNLLLTNSGQTIARTYKEFLPHVITEEIDRAVLERLFRVLSKSLLTVPPNVFALHILESLLETLSPSMYCTAAQDVFLQLIPLRNAQGVLSAMGKFIWAFGVEKIWGSVDPATKWCVVLPLLNENLYNSEISFWMKEILPGLGAKTKFENGWNALVGFCRNPKDPQNFPAEIIGKTIARQPNLRLQSLAALRQFIDWRQCDEVSKKYSKNFLPVLFNLYIDAKPNSDTLPGHADAVGATIQKYLEHCENTFIAELATRALTKLSTEVEEAASPVFDLVAFLAVHVSDKEMQDKILDVTLKKWAKLGDGKRSYRIMACLSKNKNLHGDVLQKLIDTLKQTPAETKSNAAALRLECMSVITAMNNTWLKEFLPEAIMNMLSANAKAKKLSCSYVDRYAKYLKETNQSIGDAIEIIQVGLASTIPLMISCTIRFAHFVYKELVPESPNQPVLQRCIDIISNSSDAVVWKYGLHFVTLNLQFYKGALGPIANQLGVIVSDQKYPKKDSTKLLARMIKVFGSVGVKAVLPNPDDSKMRNRIKNICKKLREKKNREDKITDNDEEEEEDSDDDEMDIDVRMSNKTPLVMKEGVVDFLNPSDIAKSFINERPKKEEDTFKLNEDGKIIIDIEDEKSKRKRKAQDDSDSDDDEDVFDDDEEGNGFLGKKRFNSKSSSASNKSSKSKYSMKSLKSTASSRKSYGGRSTNNSKQMKSSRETNKKGSLPIERKKIKAKRFKSSSSVKSSKSKKSRKSSAASNFRLKL